MSHFEAMRSVLTLEEVALNLPPLDGLATVSGSVVTLGNFDGFHLGHQALAAKVHSLSLAESLKAVLVTFHPHPREVLSNVKIPKLSTWPDLLEQFEAFHFDVIVRLKFDQELHTTSAEDFLKKLRENTNMKHLVVGYDVHIGADRKGDSEFIKNWCNSVGVGFHQIAPVQLKGTPVSSGRIRRDLEQGFVHEAAVKMGRAFSMAGTVIHGDARGRQIGFPTANLKIDPEIICPKHGVYAGWVTAGWIRRDQKKYAAVCNIGMRPTFSSPELRFEVHLLDFQADLYGSELNFEFAQFLREEIKFGSIEELKKQILLDVQKTREVLL